MNSLKATIAVERTAAPTSCEHTCPLCGSTQTLGFLTAPDRFHLRSANYRLMRCSFCSCVWLDSPPQPEEMGPHYSANYHKAIVTGAEHSGAKRWQSHRAMVARYKQRGAILDVGCSSGSFLASMNDGNWQLHGIEMNESMASKARSRSGADVFVGDIMQAPFHENSFDVVTCFDVLEHMYNPREFLERVLQWLRPGGIFFAKLPNIDSWEAKLLGTYWYGLELPRHLFHFSPRSLRPLVADVGFRELCITATEPATHLGHSVRYVWGDLLRKLGFSPTAMAEGRRTNLPWRVVRKAFGLTVMLPLSRISSAANAGVVIEAILEKPRGDRLGDT